MHSGSLLGFCLGRAQVYLMTKKQRGVSTKTERKTQSIWREKKIKYICTYICFYRLIALIFPPPPNHPLNAITHVN